MKIEKWKFEDKEIEIPILEDEEIEKNEDLDVTLDLTEVVNKVGEVNEQ